MTSQARAGILSVCTLALLFMCGCLGGGVARPKASTTRSEEADIQ